MNRGSNRVVSSAAADVAVHCFVNIGVRGPRGFLEQRRGGHDLSGLAVTALRNVLLNPGLLDRMAGVRRQTFDGYHSLSRDRRNWRHTRADCLAVDVDGACSAQ